METPSIIDALFPVEDGYLYIGSDPKRLILYEEGSGMQVHRNGLGYLLNAGAIHLPDCVAFLHNRGSAINAESVLTVTHRMQEEFPLSEVIGIGFSNGGQSICNAQEIDPVFSRVLLAGASPSKTFMESETEAVILCNSKGNIRNVDPVGRRLPGKNNRAFLWGGIHEDLDAFLRSPDFIRAYIDGVTDFGNRRTVYKDMRLIDKCWLTPVKRDLSKCKY